MHRTYKISDSQRKHFIENHIVALEEHPGFVENIAASPAPVGTARYTSSFDVLSMLITTFLREGTGREFALYLGKRTPGLLSTPAVMEALTEFIARGNTTARFIIGQKANRLSDADSKIYGVGVQEIYDPREFSWRPLGGRGAPSPANERFMITDKNCFWFNDFGSDPNDFTSSYAFRDPSMGEDLWKRFDARFNQFEL